MSDPSPGCTHWGESPFDDGPIEPAPRFCQHCAAFIDGGIAPGNAGGGAATFGRGLRDELTGPFCPACGCSLCWGCGKPTDPGDRLHFGAHRAAPAVWQCHSHPACIAKTKERLADCASRAHMRMEGTP